MSAFLRTPQSSLWPRCSGWPGRLVTCFFAFFHLCLAPSPAGQSESVRVITRSRRRRRERQRTRTDQVSALSRSACVCWLDHEVPRKYGFRDSRKSHRSENARARGSAKKKWLSASEPRALSLSISHSQQRDYRRL